jgi:hypothetical protein
MGIAIFVVLAIATGSMIFAGIYLVWWDWLSVRRKQDTNAWRRVAGLIAACGCTVQLALLLVWNVHNGSDLNFPQRLDWLRECARPGLLISLVTILVAIGSKGICRIAAVACSLGTALVWMWIAVVV